MDWLQAHRDTIFANFGDSKKNFLVMFVQTCLLPRILLEPAEALYSARFIQTIFRIKHTQLSIIFKNINDVKFYFKFI